MPSEKEKSLLKSRNYKIDGNSLTAFYDRHGKLVFVLDSTTSKVKPNVLLVMTSHGDRKWDDVLSNDYGMDLELIRPRKDNKYQKLDIEYDGLSVYDDLIQAYQDGDSTKTELKNLEKFRMMSARRAATERIAAAKTIAQNAQDTIERTSDTILELQKKIKTVRSKITTLRRGVGREPTKQSAAKILKAEAQLDVLTDKLKRAKKRLENANKRLLVAEEDIASARKVLDLIPDTNDDTEIKIRPVKASPTKTKRQVIEPDDDDDDTGFDNDDTEFDEDVDIDEDINIKDNSKPSEPDDIDLDDLDFDDDDDTESDDESDTESDKEIKPLFDKDPNIMDEKIAFKTIDFDEKPTNNFNTKDEKVENDNDTSFAPPKPIMDAIQVPNNYDDEPEIKLDDIYSQSTKDDVKYDVEPQQNTDEENVQVPGGFVPPVLDSLQSVNNEPTQTPENIPEPELESLSTPTNDSTATSDNKNIMNIVRPVAPNAAPHLAQPVKGTETAHHRPNLLYYVLLLVLIALSVFTLWLYQRSNTSSDAIPELTATSTQVVQQDVKSEPVATNDTESDDESDSDNPFIASAEEPTPEQSEPVVEKAVEASLNTVLVVSDNKPKTVVDDNDSEQKTSDDEPSVEENADDESDTVPDNESDNEPVESESEPESEPASPVTVNKPEYNVTQPDVINETKSDETPCEGNGTPDEHGCCPGETYTDMGDQGPACCPDAGGDCFPPLDM